MTAALAARGPDGEGFFVDARAGVGLGHRRLAIIDVEGGQQPLLSEDGRVACVVNGEIYNFVELRRTLERRGHRFATRSDSEVIVHGYEEWGVEVLERLEGMFALAVWDGRARRLLLARDRMGEKPLYWATLAGGGFTFASELRAIRGVPGVDASIDPAALARYLVYEYVPAPASILRGVRKLAPGERLILRPGNAPAVSRYWDLPLGRAAAETKGRHPAAANGHDGAATDGHENAGAAGRDGSAAGGHDNAGADRFDVTGTGDPDGGRGVLGRLDDADEAARLLRAELRRAVEERLVADVPLGVFLSGGLDSSTVAALAARARGGPLDTFSLGFDDPRWDESGEARRVAAHLGTRHHEERLAPAAVLELLPSMGALLDEPLGDGSIVPTHLLARFARRHVTVVLGGDGGDELFAGYPTFQAERAFGRLFDTAPPRLARAVGALGAALLAAVPSGTGYLPLDFKLRQLLRGAGERGARRHQAWLGSFSPAAALEVLAPDVAAAAGDDLGDTIDERLRACPSADRWDRLLYFYAKGYLADGVLTKVDRATMAVGLECRAPLLDRRVVALACRLAPSLRLRGLETKHVLRRAVRDLLPRATLARRKQGFGMPIGPWLRRELRPLLEDLLSPHRLAQSGLFSPAPIRRLVAEHLSGHHDHRKPLWTLLAFHLWSEIQVPTVQPTATIYEIGRSATEA